MPFTVSHVAAALPFVRTPLPIAAVVVGTMAPDIPYFLPLPIARGLTHGPLGVVTIDLVIVVAGVALWWGLLRRPMIDLAPRPVRERMPSTPWRGWRTPAGALLLLAAGLLGILTHVAWDSFTHAGWLVDRVPVLGLQVGPLPVFKVLQHVSSVLGLALLAWWVSGWIRRTPPRTDASAMSPVTGRERIAAWLIVAIGWGVAAGATWVAGILAGSSPFDPVLVFQVARVSIAVASLLALGCCAMWWSRARSARDRLR